MIGILIIVGVVILVAYLLGVVGIVNMQEEQEVHEPYEILSDRDNYNKNMKEIAFWVGADDYQDYDGNKRRL